MRKAGAPVEPEGRAQPAYPTRCRETRAPRMMRTHNYQILRALPQEA